MPKTIVYFIALAFFAVVGAVAQTSSSNNPDQTVTASQPHDTLAPGEALFPGNDRVSANRLFDLFYESDGRVLLTGPAGILWGSNTLGSGVLGTLIMQTDGNLVLYDHSGRALWSSGTNGSPGSHLTVQDDGNVVIYRPDGTAIWQTNTWVPIGPIAQGDLMQPGEVLFPAQSIISADGRFKFIYQIDGNLVLYSNNVALWNSHTNGLSAGICIMQTDGNLVIYAPGGHPLWWSGTNGNFFSHLLVQDDGNVVIYRDNGPAIWATNTVQ